MTFIHYSFWSFFKWIRVMFWLIELLFTTLWANSAVNKLVTFFQIGDIFYFPRKQDLIFHANFLHWGQFAWNVKSTFLGKIFQNVVCCNFYPVKDQASKIIKIRNIFQNVVCWNFNPVLCIKNLASKTILVTIYAAHFASWFVFVCYIFLCVTPALWLTSSVCFLFFADTLMLSTLGKFFSWQHFEIFFYFSPENKIRYFMQIVFTRDNLHEVSNPVFWEK